MGIEPTMSCTRGVHSTNSTTEAHSASAISFTYFVISDTDRESRSTEIFAIRNMEVRRQIDEIAVFRILRCTEDCYREVHLY